MHSHDALKEPYVLTPIPKPFSATNGKALASTVIKFCRPHLRIRQRPEVVVAIDGEGLYVYNIENPRLITSYALSPQTNFVCKPSSFIRTRSDQSVQRVTHAAIKEQGSQLTRIICFVEDFENGVQAEYGRASFIRTEIDVQRPNALITSILPIPQPSGNEDLKQMFNLAVIYASNEIDFLAADLSSNIQNFKIPGGDLEASEIATISAHVVSPTRARKCFLRTTTSSPDLFLDGKENAYAQTPNVLVLLQADKRRVSIHLVKCTPNAAAPVDKCIRVELSNQLRELKDEISSAQLSSDCTELYILLSDRLSIQSLTQKTSLSQFLYADKITSFLPITTSQAVVQTSGELRLISSHDSSDTVAGVRIPNDQLIKAGSKRSREGKANFTDEVQLVDHHLASQLVIALVPGSLIAIPINQNNDSTRVKIGHHSKKLSEVLLLHSGAQKVLQSEALDNGKRGAQFTKFTDHVEELVSAGSWAALVEFVAKDLGILYTYGDRTSDAATIVDDAQNTTQSLTGNIPQWTFPHNDAAIIRKTDLLKARFVLQQLIKIDEVDGAATMTIIFYNASLFRWFALVGLLQFDRVIHGSTYTRTPAGSFTKAIASLDPTLSCLRDMLSWNFHLDLEELVQSLDIVIESLDNPLDNDTLAIKQIDDESDESHVQNVDRSLNEASKAAEDDLALAIASLDHGRDTRGDLLHSIFFRLSAFPHDQVVRILRLMLVPRRCIFLINLLRIELAEGGWTTRYTDDIYEENYATDDEQGSPADASINVIVELLNAAVDAIGPSGWNVGLSSDKALNTDDMIVVLRAEITAALEGCQEIQAIGSAIQEFGKYCAELQADNPSSKKRRLVDPIKNPGFLNVEIKDTTMPMGGRVEVIDRTKTSKGGQIKMKSKGAIGQAISMRVGNYSIDRIRV